MHIPSIVLTGGPCSGKTSAIAYIVGRLRELGWTPFVVPETATELIGAGFCPGRNVAFPPFQQELFRLQALKEDCWRGLAASSEARHPVLILDRGLMDGLAYVDAPALQPVAEELGYASLAQVRDQRYDAVLHLRSAALGAETHYTCANNTARFEEPGEAQRLDEATLRTWVGHPHLRVIDNSTDFEGKLERVWQEVCMALGIPEPVEIERKWLVEAIVSLDVPHAAVEIEQIYLVPAEEHLTERIRVRSQDGVPLTYHHTLKGPSRGGVKMEREERISASAFRQILERADPERRPILKRRCYFVYENQYCELDLFHSHPGLALLEIELREPDQPVLLAPFLKVQREVTGDPAYSNSHLARTT